MGLVRGSEPSHPHVRVGGEGYAKPGGEKLVAEKKDEKVRNMFLLSFSFLLSRDIKLLRRLLSP